MKPAPKNRAKMVSRTSPRTRENITAIETIPAERATLACLGFGSAALTAAVSEVGSADSSEFSSGSLWVAFIGQAQNYEFATIAEREQAGNKNGGRIGPPFGY